MKSGKAPLSERSNSGPSLNPAEEFGDLLHVSKEYKSKAKEAGFEIKWLDAKTLTENQGFHKSAWQPVKADDFGGFSNNVFGNSPDGIVRRGTLVLGKRSIEYGNYFRAKKHERDMAHAKIAKTQRDDLKKFAKEHEIETVINDRYED